MNRLLFPALLVTILGIGAWGVAAQDQHGHDQPGEATGALKTPAAIVEEHRHLHEQLEAAIAAGGQTAEKARVVGEVLGRHFEQEEAYAMPPLGLLEPLAHGRQVSEEDSAKAIEMATRLREEYESMLEEHRELTAALDALSEAAERENQPEAKAFAEGLKLHAQNEEQVLYPATLLIGEYLKLRREQH